MNVIDFGYMNSTHPGSPPTSNWTYHGKLNIPQMVLSRQDTATVPPQAYVVVRIEANNGGPWLSHCHNNWHLNGGMAFVLNVSEQGKYPNMKPPSKNVTVCGAFARWGELS